MLIKKLAVNEFLGRKFDDHRWMKALTTQQLHEELCAMKVQPYFKTQPWLHQLVCFWIGIYFPHFLFLLDMGAGKTKILLDLITQMQREKRLDHALVCVPRLINIDSWCDDIERHSDLEPWMVNVEERDWKYELLVEPEGDVTLIDYMGLHLALSQKRTGGKKGAVLIPDEKRVRQVKKKYNVICLDESHKLGNHETLWFALLRRLTENVDACYATTGTLFGRDPQAIWPQFFLVDRGDTFGENMGMFRAAFFTAEANKWGRGEKYTYDQSNDRVLHRMLQHRSLRYDENELQDLPKRVHRLHQYSMSAEQFEHYMLAMEGLINAGNGTEERKGQWIRMRQIVSGYLAWDDDDGQRRIRRFKDNPKLDDLESLIDGLDPSQKCIVPYDYTETGAMICDRLKQMKIDHEWFYGGTKDQSASKHRFMSDPKCRVFVMNTAAGGTGNDGLQKVAQYMFIYETPNNPIDRKQLIKRIHRAGMAGRAFYYDMVMRRSLDAGILDKLQLSMDLYDDVVKKGGKGLRGFFTKELASDYQILI